MIEMPEAYSLAAQLGSTLAGRTVSNVTADHSPHGFAWYHGDPASYHQRLVGQRVQAAKSHGGLVEVTMERAAVLFGDGVNIRFHQAGDKRPKKHQLLVEFEDGTALTGSVQMYGGLWCFEPGTFDNGYYEVAKAKPTPLDSDFDEAYFASLVDAPEVERLSVKALLATEQRIPGLGNGVLQDILFRAGVHPKRKTSTLTDAERSALFRSVKQTLADMARGGGRSTEKNLFGKSGGYQVLMSRYTVGTPCLQCQTPVEKASYLGGSIYFCSTCQAL